MPFSLYQAVVPTNLQMLGSVADLLGKAEAFCRDRDIAPDDVLGARLAPDMLPYSYQVKSTAEHSWGAIQGVRAGQFSPSLAPPPASFDELKDKVEGARVALTALDPAEVDGFVGQDMLFLFGETRIPFAAEDFLLSFAQPNFYFHATATYAILRHLGVKLGKRDFLGALQIKTT